MLSIRLGYLSGAGALFSVESSIPAQLQRINTGLERLGVPKRSRLFFDIHCELDAAHSVDWWNFAIKDYLNTPQELDELMLGVDLAICARNQLWKGLCSGVNV